MLAAMTSPPPPANAVIQRAYRLATALRSCAVSPTDTRVSMLITMEEAFALLDSSTSGPWQLDVWTYRPGGDKGQTARFDLKVSPKPGMFWAVLFGVSLIVEDDVGACET